MLAWVVEVIKRFFLRQDVYAVLIVVLVGAVSFGLGRLSHVTAGHHEVAIEEVFSDVITAAPAASDSEEGAADVLVVPAQEGQFVGSRNSDKYHFPWCSGAQRIKEENKVWFATREEAAGAGYVPAGNCEGL